MKTVIRLATLLICSVAIAVGGCVSSSQMNAAKSMAPGTSRRRRTGSEFSSTTTGLKYKILRKSEWQNADRARYGYRQLQRLVG